MARKLTYQEFMLGKLTHLGVTRLRSRTGPDGGPEFVVETPNLDITLTASKNRWDADRQGVVDAWMEELEKLLLKAKEKGPGDQGP